MQLRIGSYNIKHCDVGGKIDLPRVADIIEGLNVDLIALQEVHKFSKKSGNTHQPRELANRAGFPYCVFGKATASDGGEAGNAILSKFPINSWTIKSIQPVNGTSYNQMRCLVLTKHTLPNGSALTFCSTHFGFEAAQMQGVWAVANTKLGNVIVGGDFNCSHGSVPFECMENWFAPASTGAEIDNFLYRGAVTGIDYQVVSDGTPDHSPAVATVEIS
jgi:endonuclease/exonuclease/phosphatase family metal-dependent hydrolase